MSKRICPWPGVFAVIGMVMLTGCVQPAATTRFDMALEHAQTSPIPGASAKVMAPPPGIVYSGAAVGTCVTAAGYCALAAQTEPGQNCLCTAADGTYGGTTGNAPKTLPE